MIGKDLVGCKERVHKNVVDPRCVVSVTSRIRDPRSGNALDRAMGQTDNGQCFFDFWHCTVGRRGHICRRSGKAAQWILSIIRVVGDSGHHFGMGRLDEERPNATDHRATSQ